MKMKAEGVHFGTLKIELSSSMWRNLIIHIRAYEVFLAYAFFIFVGWWLLKNEPSYLKSTGSSERKNAFRYFKDDFFDSKKRKVKCYVSKIYWYNYMILSDVMNVIKFILPLISIYYSNTIKLFSNKLPY